jgi:transglutaminase-like putative cysteine protease
MEGGHGEVMVYRLSWIAGILGIVLALARSARLVRASVEGIPWQVVVLAAAVFGAALTWAALAFGFRTRWVALANVIAASLMVLRVAVPETTWFVFPTASSVEALGGHLSLAREVIRGGVAPVIPSAGIVAIIAVVFWALGSILAGGLLAGRPYVAVLSPLVVYLEFAVMDRRPATGWATLFMLLIGFCLLAVTLDQRRSGTGLLTARDTRRSLARSTPALGAIMIVAVVAVSQTAGGAVVDLVPRSGHLDWRSRTGLSGEYFGSVSYNPFVGIHQRLTSPSNTPVFTVDVDGPIDGRSIYWRLVTLDSFDGASWHIDPGTRIVAPVEGDDFESPAMAFAGPTARVTADITIAALRMDWLPAPYSPVALGSSDSSLERVIRVRQDDGSLRFDALTFRGMAYTVVSDVPQPDFAVLALAADGRPSTMFSASEALADPASLPSLPPSRPLPRRDHFLRLPDDLNRGIAALARRTTADLHTDFERAVALESFFRTGGFVYSTEIEPGHGAQDLHDWLLDPESPNFRTGYCEQFATAMAVMARTVGLPSRVVLGFTPGTAASDGTIVVRDRNAHAWVEVWMPTQGWVAFDPTPRSDGINPATSEGLPFGVIEYLASSPEAPGLPVPPGGEELDPNIEEFGGGTAPTDLGEVSEPGFGMPSPSRVLLAVLVVGCVVAAVPVAKWRRRKVRLRRFRDGDVSAAWQEIIDRLSDLGDPPPPTATPAEIADGTSPALAPLAAVYAEVAYGPDPMPSPEHVSVAARSLSATETQFVGRYSFRRRLAARYSLVSIVPPRWRLWRRR